MTDVCEPIFYGLERSFQPGVLSGEAGQAAYQTIVRAVRDAQAGEIHGIATAPINKEALALAGLPWRGHTEMLASLTNTAHVAMMFWSQKLRVVLATIHIPLVEVPAALTLDSVGRIIELTHRELPRFGLANPRLALAGLNPHAGEHGLLGQRGNRSARASCCALCKGWDQHHRAVAWRYRLRSCDAWRVRRGHRVLSRSRTDSREAGRIWQAVNVTLGLPIIRTSVDHGTAFDIAGKNIADPESMVQAVLLAAKLAIALSSISDSHVSWCAGNDRRATTLGDCHGSPRNRQCPVAWLADGISRHCVARLCHYRLPLPVVTVIHATLLTVVQAHRGTGRHRVGQAVHQPQSRVCDVDERVKLQVPLCVTVSVCPAIVSVPVREVVEVLAVTL